MGEPLYLIVAVAADVRRRMNQAMVPVRMVSRGHSIEERSKSSLPLDHSVNSWSRALRIWTGSPPRLSS